ncbi:LytR/AlgR family response regulator transcription factor [Algoriphagus persicinus]|uniref:LytR/AlgR family response regulator transcription factor n=1 Tax=Algoriphagus persicinus TaxID=3108754 RepID=UPI002B3AF71B|nr:LytTR family DNA-binding domain-containing protein [Algoriphagus sp. E1-3-M2]MEB2787183.1 LytTR family DNA-binding domain-containing protein [Algoriphagus sp. E1-3-M2]
MEKLKLVLIDDEQDGLNVLKKLVDDSPNLEITYLSTDPVAAFKFMQENPPDILITDIVMETMHGIQLASKVEKLNIPVIICSAYDEYAYDGFQVNAVHFIKKPANMSSFFNAIEKVSAKFHRPAVNTGYFPNCLTITEQGSSSMILLRSDDILYLQVEGNYVEMNTMSKKYTVMSSLSSIMERLPKKDFYRVHKSFAISMKKILHVKLETIHLEGGAAIPLGRVYSKEFYEIFRKISINGTASGVIS